MKNIHFLPGDVVEYKPDCILAGNRDTVGPNPIYQSSYSDDGLQLTQGVWDEARRFNLVERGNKKVKSIIVNSKGEPRIEFEDGTTSRFYNREARWATTPRKSNQERLEQNSNEGWTYEYKAPAEEQAPSVDDALAKVKAEYNLCYQFDEQVKRAKKIAGTDGDLVSALELVAKDQDRVDLFEAFQRHLKPRKIKWAKGTWIALKTLKDFDSYGDIYHLTENVYERDEKWHADLWEGMVSEFRPIEWKWQS